MKKLLLTTATAIAMMLGTIYAKAASTISVTDFLLDWKNYQHSQVTVKDCTLLSLGPSLVYCYADSKNLTASFVLNGENLPREDRKVLLSGCTLLPEPNCVADVTGIGSSMMFGPSLSNVSLKWTKTPSTPPETKDQKLKEMIDRTNKEQQMAATPATNSYTYLCQDHNKTYPVVVDEDKGTISWRGTTFTDLKPIEDCRYAWQATANGVTAELCTATQGVATLTIGKEDFDCQMPEKYRK